MGVDLSRVLDGLPAMVWTAVPDGNVDFVNQRWSDYTGLGLGDARGWKWQSVIKMDDLPRLLERWRSILASGQPGEMEARIRRLDGQYRWFLVQANPIRDDAGQIVKWCGVSIDMEDRKRADDDLHASDRDARQILDGMPGLVATFTPDGEVEGVNRQVLEYFGMTVDELKNWGTGDAVHPEDLPRCVEIFANAIASGEPFELECRSRRFDGVYRWFQSRGYPSRDSNGRIVRWYNLLIDIDDRKRAEYALRKSQTELRHAQRELQRTMDSIPVLVSAFHADGTRIFVNKTWEISTGLTLQDVTDETQASLRPHCHPDDAAPLARKIDAALADGEPLPFEVRLRCANGEYRWHSFRRVPLRDENGAIIRWYSSGFDIHDRVMAEEALRRSEAFLAKGESASLTGTFSWDFATGAFTWSEQLYRIYEFEPGAQITFELIATRYHPDDKALIARVAEQARSGGIPNFDYSHRLLMPNGSIKHVRVVAHRNQSEDGRVEYFGAVQDVTQRHLADEARRLSEGRWTRIVDNSAIGIAVNDLKGRFEVANAAFQKLTGFTEEELREFRYCDITEPQFREQNLTALADLLRGKRDQFNIEEQCRCKDGRVIWVRSNISLLPGADGSPRNILAIIEDISSRKAAEDSLRTTQARLARAAELATGAELSASIAHEINQPLAGIINNANTCLRMLGAEPPNVDGARETARRTLRDGNRASEVVKRLRALFGKDQPMFEPVDLNEAAREVIALLLNGIQANRVVLRTEFASDLPSVEGDRLQLQQVILNLIRNAIDAMTAVDDRIRQLTITTQRDEGNHVRLKVKDTGIGLAPDAVDRVFESFYTTKSGGMGIGLAICRSTIEGHHGRLWAETNDGPGVTFSFSIPRRFEQLTDASCLDAAGPAGTDLLESQHDV